MKRKWGVIVLLLPIKKQPAGTGIYPPQPNDVLLPETMQLLTAAAPATVPLSLLRRKKLVLNLFTQQTGHTLALFPDLIPLQKSTATRVHLLLLTLAKAERFSAYLGNTGYLFELGLPVLTADEGLQKLFVTHRWPHALFISPGGKLETILEGSYITAKNIRQAAGGIPSFPKLTKMPPEIHASC